MTEKTPEGFTMAPDGSDVWTLEGRVVEKVLNEGTPMARRLPFVLQQEPEGNFLALIRKKHDLSSFLGRRVKVVGKVWFQSLTAESITEIAELS